MTPVSYLYLSLHRRCQLRAFVVSLMACLAVSCQKYNFEEESENGGEIVENLTTVKVRTRADGTAQLEYPLFIYAFSQSGSLLASQKINSSDEQMSVRIPAGEESRIVALSADESVYDIPSSPQLSSAVTMKALASDEHERTVGRGYVLSHPLQMGYADISPTSQKATVTIQLSYQMASISAVLQNMPASSPTVSIKVSASGGGLCLDGSLTESTGVLIPLHKQSEGNGTWVSDEVYIFPTMGNQTNFTIMYGGDDGEEYASVNYMALLESGTPYKLNGAFSDGSLEVSGNILPSDWGQPVNLNFGFSSSGLTKISPDGNDGEDDSSEGEVDAVSSAVSEWDGHIVAAVSEEADGTVSVMLLSREDWGSLTSVKSASTEAFNIENGYSEDGLGEWHIPTQDEARLLRSAYLEHTDGFDALMEEMGADAFALTDEKGNNLRYLCEGASMTYSMKAGSSYNSIKEAGATVKNYHLRLVKIVSLKIKD